MSKAIILSGLIGLVGGYGIALTTNGAAGFFLGVVTFIVLAKLSAKPNKSS